MRAMTACMDFLRLSPTSLFLLLQVLLLPVEAQSCRQYQIAGQNGSATFNHYTFYDYRRLYKQESGTPYYTQNMGFNNPVFGLSTSPFFNSTPWTDNWSTTAITSLNNVTRSEYIPLVYTALNVAIAEDTSTSSETDTVLALSTTRLNTYSTGAQVHTNQYFYHASFRMSARIVGASGACAAFFVYGDDNNESDIELLTNDTNTMFHATSHPSRDALGEAIPGATNLVAIPKNGSTPSGGTAIGGIRTGQNATYNDWVEYRMDWLPDRVDWVVNGVNVLTKTLNVPKIPAWLGLNMWSNGGTWTGNMTINSTATLQVRWIEIVYNTTNDNATGAGAATGSVCTVRDNNDGFNGFPNVNAAGGGKIMAMESSFRLGTMVVGFWVCLWFLSLGRGLV